MRACAGTLCALLADFGLAHGPTQEGIAGYSRTSVATDIYSLEHHWKKPGGYTPTGVRKAANAEFLLG